MLSILLCDTASFCILQVHVVPSRNAIANLALLPQYTHFECSCELAGGEEALPDFVHYIYYHRIVNS